MSLKNGVAGAPPLGWNSWDCYGPTVREDEVKANTDFMAAHLARHGWSTVVVDIQWYEPLAQAGGYRPNADLITDEYGRLLPALNRFPSAANGAGFRPLGDYIHSKGLKFGIHIMRGIPRQSVRANLPVYGSDFRAQNAADTSSVCPWNTDMYGLDTSKPGARAYMDSLVKLYSSWGVDYVKADDMLYPYHDREIALLHDALARADREIVLSLSPGVEMTTDYYPHLSQHSELFRISGDFWDRWDDLKSQFALCRQWQAHTAPGCWADADMLPLGHIGIRAERGIDRQSLLTRDEQVMLMTLWAIFRSPLMFGGDLPSSDAFTISLLTNDEVLALNQSSAGNRELLRDGDSVVWTANSTTSADQYLALFNLADSAAPVGIDLTLLGGAGRYAARDLWAGSSIGDISGRFEQVLAPHAARLFRLSPAL